jgi:hypothetical protein
MAIEGMISHGMTSRGWSAIRVLRGRLENILRCSIAFFSPPLVLCEDFLPNGSGKVEHLNLCRIRIYQPFADVMVTYVFLSLRVLLIKYFFMWTETSSTTHLRRDALREEHM